MLKKNILLATILGLSFNLEVIYAKTSAWQTVSINQIIDNQTYLTDQRWRIRPLGIDVPVKARQNRCYQSRLNNFLQQKIIDQPVKIKFDTHHFKRQLHREAHIKFDKTHDLAEFLLRQGWAKTNNKPHSRTKIHKAAQAEAIKHKRGLWGECNNWHQIKERQRLKGHTIYFNPQHKSYLQNTATGWVSKVLSPTRLQLHNGVKIKLQALTEPQKDSAINQCWQQSLRSQLEALLIGKKVHLHKDQLQLTNQGQYLQRYVWVEGNQYQPSLFLNEYLLSVGAVGLNPNDLNLRYVAQLNAAAQTGLKLKNPPNWWQQCAKQVIVQSGDSVVEPELIYDKDCPIKGNIAGSKKNPKLTYHTPLSGWYKRIKYEQCFETEAEAQTAGFIKVK